MSRGRWTHGAAAAALVAGAFAAIWIGRPAAGAVHLDTNVAAPTTVTSSRSAVGAPPGQTLPALKTWMAKWSEPVADSEDEDDDGARRVTLNEMKVLSARCAPTTPTSVLDSIVQVESGFDPLAIGVNGRRHQSLRFASRAAAIAKAKALISQGQRIDLGIAQVSSANLAGLGLSVEDAFDACKNLAAASRLIDEGYARALERGKPRRSILQMTYSIYNTGDTARGLANGYAESVTTSADTRGR